MRPQAKPVGQAPQRVSQAGAGPQQARSSGAQQMATGNGGTPQTQAGRANNMQGSAMNSSVPVQRYNPLPVGFNLSNNAPARFPGQAPGAPQASTAGTTQNLRQQHTRDAYEAANPYFQYGPTSGLTQRGRPGILRPIMTATPGVDVAPNQSLYEQDRARKDPFQRDRPAFGARPLQYVDSSGLAAKQQANLENAGAGGVVGQAVGIMGDVFGWGRQTPQEPDPGAGGVGPVDNPLATGTSGQGLAPGGPPQPMAPVGQGGLQQPNVGALPPGVQPPPQQGQVSMAGQPMGIVGQQQPPPQQQAPQQQGPAYSVAGAGQQPPPSNQQQQQGGQQQQQQGNQQSQQSGDTTGQSYQDGQTGGVDGYGDSEMGRGLANGNMDRTLTDDWGAIAKDLGTDPDFIKYLAEQGYEFYRRGDGSIAWYHPSETDSYQKFNSDQDAGDFYDEMRGDEVGQEHMKWGHEKRVNESQNAYDQAGENEAADFQKWWEETVKGNQISMQEADARAAEMQRAMEARYAQDRSQGLQLQSMLSSRAGVSPEAQMGQQGTMLAQRDVGHEQNLASANMDMAKQKIDLQIRAADRLYNAAMQKYMTSRDRTTQERALLAARQAEQMRAEAEMWMYNASQPGVGDYILGGLGAVGGAIPGIGSVAGMFSGGSRKSRGPDDWV